MSDATLTLTANGLVRVDAPWALTHTDTFQRACRAAGFFFQAYPAPAQYGAQENVRILVRELNKIGVSSHLEGALAAALRAKATASTAWKGALLSRIQGLKANGLTLKPYQRQDAIDIAQRRAVLLAHEMRVGKTVICLTALDADARAVVVCPKVVKGAWRKATAQWRPDLRVTVLEKPGEFRWPTAGEIIVTHYEALPEKVGRPPEGVVAIVDECHRIKGAKTKQTLRTRAVTKAALFMKGKCWLLSGTPLLNKQPELWNVLEAADLGKQAFGSYSGFCQVMGARIGQYGPEWGLPTQRGKELLAKVLIRRTRAEVLPELPVKSYQDIGVEVDENLRKILEEMRLLIERSGGDYEAFVMGHIDITTVSRLRAAVAAAKVPSLLQEVGAHEADGEPLVVFSAHTEPLRTLAKRKGWALIDGSVSSSAREKAMRDFQDGKLIGLACAIKAAGVGVDLTRANRVLFLDREWVPALNEQAEDRLLGINQKRGVLVSTLVCDHPVEQRLYEILLTKQARVNRLF